MLSRPEIVALFGKGGQGKSTLARFLLRGARRVIALDPKFEPDAARGRVIANTCAELVELAQARSFDICFRGFGADPETAFEFCNRVALAAGDCWLHWEEVDLFVRANGRLPPSAYQVVNQGRHDGVRVIACARRPVRVARDYTASATRIIVFQTAEPRDVRYLEEYIGQAARDVRTLPQWHALDWQERAGARVRAAPFS
jgi:hypothetical protein